MGSQDFTVTDYAEFKTAFEELSAQVGVFDSNQALMAIGELRPALDADAVERLLQRMTDLGYLWEVGWYGLERAKLWAYAGDANAND
jgi:hypothetical protein